MRWFGVVQVLGVLAVAAGPATAATGPGRLFDPALRLPRSAPGVTRVALTFDACDGKVDRRILDVLEADAIPATIFVSGKWLARNPQTFAELLSHPDLFEIEDHGARHVPAVGFPTRVYGLKAAGSPAAVQAEVQGGAEALLAAGAGNPHWFRGAAAKYDAAAMTQIEAAGYRIGGYSRNGDGGASFSTALAEKTVAAAQDGDVILAHLNQPRRPAGAGVAAGIAALKARGVAFVRLEDAFPDTQSGSGR